MLFYAFPFTQTDIYNGVTSTFLKMKQLSAYKNRNTTNPEFYLGNE